MAAVDGLQLVLALMLALLAGGGAHALRCYKCTVLPPPASSNETARLCSHFDGSERFQVSCPYSTLCLKKTFELQLMGQTVSGVERDCAPQRYDYQTFNERQQRWETEFAVADGAYEPGCAPERGGAARAFKSAAATYCYCRSNLCNGAARAAGVAGAGRGLDPAAPHHHHTDAMAVIFVFNAMKYIRSLR